MRLTIDYTSGDGKGVRESFKMDVEYNSRVDDVLALLTVQNT